MPSSRQRSSPYSCPCPRRRSVVDQRTRGRHGRSRSRDARNRRCSWHRPIRNPSRHHAPMAHDCRAPPVTASLENPPRHRFPFRCLPSFASTQDTPGNGVGFGHGTGRKRRALVRRSRLSGEPSRSDKNSLENRDLSSVVSHRSAHRPQPVRVRLRVYAGSNRIRSRVPVAFATFSSVRVDSGIRPLSSRTTADCVVFMRAASSA